jgi:glycosyltransferase involved in cell wall biosynthesis
VVIAGDGPEKAGLLRYAQEHGLENVLEIPGHVLGESKWALYDENEIFLFPSSSEGCPLVVLEAMGAGLAIVSRPVGAIPDIVKDHENGFVINSLKSEDFFRMVKTLMDDPVLLLKMRQANKKVAEERFEAKIVTRKMEAVFLSIMDQTAE